MKLLSAILLILVLLILMMNIVILLAIWRWMKRRDRALAENLRESLRQRHELEQLRRCNSGEVNPSSIVSQRNERETQCKDMAQKLRIL